MITLGPGTPLICINADGADDLTQDALYTCEEIHGGEMDQQCEVCDGPVCVGRVHLVGKYFHHFLYGWGPLCYCVMRFKPLNDGDTSLMDDEEPLGYEDQLEKMRPVTA
jgi:hypothetical protein